jgi:ferric-chelate reductase [NAD(P)H]
MTDQLNMKALFQLSYGLYIVSSHLDGKPNGQIANTFFQATAQPPRLAACLNKENLTHEYVAKSGVFGVSILDQETPFQFIGAFGFKSGKDVNKFENVSYITGVTGVPIVTDNALSYIELKVMGTMDAGTHTLFIGDLANCQVLKEGTPLTYKYYHEVIKGKTPEKATTYQATPGK